jgi:hypothetical protein
MLTPPQSDVAGVVREALLRCHTSTLGAVTPATDEDAKTLFDAGLSWTHTHWWRQLNTRGLAARQMILAASQRTTGDE